MRRRTKMILKNQRAWDIDISQSKVYKKLAGSPNIFLIRINNGEFIQSSGYLVGNGLMITRPIINGVAVGYWVVSDKATGLNVGGGRFKSFSSAIDFLNKNGYANDLNERIENARKTDKYTIRCLELSNEREVLKRAGYELL